MVIDTSILLSIFFNEEHAIWSEEQLEHYRPALRMSTINLSETLIRIQDRQPQDFKDIKEVILSSGIRFVPPTVKQVIKSAEARMLFPLNLGDCFASETVFFTMAHRGLVHTFDGPVSWAPGDLGWDLLRTGMTLGVLKGAHFIGRQALMRQMRLNEAAPAAWTRAEHQAMFWGGQLSGYLGLVGSHALQEKVGLIPLGAGGNLWLDALATHMALGVGSHAGRALMGRSLARIEHRMAAKAQALYQPDGGPARASLLRNYLEPVRNWESVAECIFDGERNSL